MSETITRKVTVEVEFHHLDMMRVVHNSQYLCWFERGRFAVLEDVFPMQWAIDNMVGTPVVMSHCEYLAAVHYGDVLVVTTRHRKSTEWNGRFVFEHSISNKKTKVEVCRGQTAATVVDLNTGKLFKELPADVWARYRALD